MDGDSFRWGTTLLLWPPHVDTDLQSTLEHARNGRPTVLVVLGDAGLGKTALLHDLVSRAPDFRVLKSDGLEDDGSPFTLLAQWDAEPVRGTDGGQPTTRMAAQALRDRLDALASSGPVLLVADDLHWADSESVDALLWLLRRTSGDRLLVAVGTRPLPPDKHPGWQRWLAAGREQVVTIALSGLTVAQVAQLARRRWPALTDDMARRLHEHTDGNPLYLASLVAENELADLAGTGMLPAPAAFARSIALRTARLSGPALTLLRAACVLGSNWTPLSLIAGTAEVGEATAAAQELIEAGLVELRGVDGPVQLRPGHALIRTSVYRQTPLLWVRRLNARAATLVDSRSAQLHHRMAAAEQYDAELAQEMETHATQLYDQRSFREAGHYLRWASGLTPDPALRERRWLESIYDGVLAFDLAAVDAQLDDVARASFSEWSALVLGTRAAWGRRYREAAEQLDPVAARPVDASDPRARYRIEVILAWARLCLGEPTELVAQGLARAAAIRRADAGVDSLELVVSSQVTLRMHGAGPVLHTLAALPAASATPLAATGALAFRGALRTALGLFADADRDLTEVTRRMSDGEVEVGAGSYQAQLGWVQWLTGDWGRSRISFRQAFDTPSGIAHQFTLALAPLVDIGVGRFEVADAGLARAREVLADSPWPEACVLALGTTLVRLHAGGSARERATALERWQDGPLRVVDVQRPSPVFLLNYIPALLWAGRLDDADAAVSFLAHIEPAAPWSATVAHWYGGLVRAARGDVRAAFDELGSALTGPLGLPLYRAHLLLDHAELARRLDRPGAESSLRQAQEIYDRLGAAPYLERVHLLLATPVERLPGGVTLTEREHDVLTLIVAGMSYAQISRELFITQSTVGYHLGNIYRKTGVSSRHQLTEKARKSPRTFGI